MRSFSSVSQGIFLQSAETVRMIVLPAESLDRKQNHADRLDRKPSIIHSSPGRKQKMADSRSGSKLRLTVSAGIENCRTSLYPVCVVPANGT